MNQHHSDLASSANYASQGSDPKAACALVAYLSGFLPLYFLSSARFAHISFLRMEHDGLCVRLSYVLAFSQHVVTKAHYIHGPHVSRLSTLLLFWSFMRFST